VKALVIGADGQVGSVLPSRLERLGVADVVAVGRADIDLLVPESVRAGVEGAAPDVVVNCAAYNAVDQAEDDAAAAHAVNATAPGLLAEVCREAGAHFIHISTDYVFSGDKGSPYVESDEPAPRSEYGRSKLAGEQAVEAAGGSWTVVRTALVFGSIGRSLVELIAGRGLDGLPLSMVVDQRGSPTSAGDLAGVLAEMAVRRCEGLFHVANAGDCSPYELAHFIFGVAGLDPSVIGHTTAAEFGRPASRPANSALISERLADAGIAPLRHFHEAVEERVLEMVAARSRA